MTITTANDCSNSDSGTTSGGSIGQSKAEGLRRNDEQPDKDCSASSTIRRTTESEIDRDRDHEQDQDQDQGHGLCQAKLRRNTRRAGHQQRVGSTIKDSTTTMIVALKDEGDRSSTKKTKQTRSSRSKSRGRYRASEETTTPTASEELEHPIKRSSRRHTSKGRRGREGKPAAEAQDEVQQQQQQQQQQPSHQKENPIKTISRSKSRRRSEPQATSTTTAAVAAIYEVEEGTPRRTKTHRAQNKISATTSAASVVEAKCSSSSSPRTTNKKSSRSRSRRRRSFGKEATKTVDSNPVAVEDLTSQAEEKSSRKGSRRYRSRRRIGTQTRQEEDGSKKAQVEREKMLDASRKKSSEIDPHDNDDHHAILTASADADLEAKAEVVQQENLGDSMPNIKAATSFPCLEPEIAKDVDDGVSEDGIQPDGTILEEDEKLIHPTRVWPNQAEITATEDDPNNLLDEKEDLVDEDEDEDEDEDANDNVDGESNNYKSTHRRNIILAAVSQVNQIKNTSTRSLRSIKSVLSGSSHRLSKSSHSIRRRSSVTDIGGCGSSTGSSARLSMSSHSIRRRSSLTAKVHYEEYNSHDDDDGFDLEDDDIFDDDDDYCDDEKNDSFHYDSFHHDSFSMESTPDEAAVSTTLPPPPAVDQKEMEFRKLLEEVAGSPTSVMSPSGGPRRKKVSIIHKRLQAFATNKKTGGTLLLFGGKNPKQTNKKDMTTSSKMDKEWENNEVISSLKRASSITSPVDPIGTSSISLRGSNHQSRSFLPQSPLASPLQKLKKKLGATGNNTALLSATSYLDLEDTLNSSGEGDLQDDDDDDHHHTNDPHTVETDKMISKLFSKVDNLDPTQLGDSWSSSPSDDEGDAKEEYHDQDDSEYGTILDTPADCIQFHHQTTGET